MAKALTGLRVLDLSGALSGPFCSVILGDLGAEIIKIEPPEGDIFRNIGPYYQGEWSGYFVAVNRNKRGIVLNLKTEAGLESFYDLVRVSDVVLDNFRGGVVERLRIDYPVLREINPRIISCSVTGFGPTGVYRNRAAFDLCVKGNGLGNVYCEPDTPHLSSRPCPWVAAPPPGTSRPTTSLLFTSSTSSASPAAGRGTDTSRTDSCRSSSHRAFK